MKKKNIIFLLILAIALMPGCTSLFFHPSKRLHPTPLLKNVNQEDVYFKTPDGLTLHGWLLKPKHNKNFGVILHLHGNAENITAHVNNVLWLVEEGFTVFTFDYRGYGKSEGSPEIEGVHIDAETALEKTLNISAGANKKIIVFGQSLGGAIAVYTVANTKHRKNINALILDSPFSGYRKIAREKVSQIVLAWPIRHPLSLLINDYYSPAEWIKKTAPIPLLIMHGKNDPVIPTHHSLILFAQAGEPKDLWITETDGHILSLADKDVKERLIDYLKRLEQSQ